MRYHHFLLWTYPILLCIVLNSLPISYLKLLAFFIELNQLHQFWDSLYVLEQERPEEGLSLILQHNELLYEQARLLLFLHPYLSSIYFFFYLISLYFYQNSLKIIDQLVLALTLVTNFFGKIHPQF